MTHSTTPPDAIADALFGRTRRNVLALLFGDPESRFFLRQIVRRTGTGVGSVQRELAQLSEAGLIDRSPEGNQVYFRANPASPVFAELCGLVNKTTGIADALRRALLDFDSAAAIEHAFLYGSVATGSHGASSDVDVLIIGPITLRSLVPVLRDFQESIGREVNAVVFESAEFRANIEDRQHFASRVLEQPKIMLIGDEDDLARLGGESLAT